MQAGSVSKIAHLKELNC